MNPSKHTPGSWHVAMHNEPQDYPSGAAYLAEVWAHDGEQPVAIATDAADAHLIAATPALRELADHVLAMADDAYLSGHPEFAAICDEARAALAKAGA